MSSPLVDTDDLRQELTEYDGRSPSILSEILVRRHGRPGFLPGLTELASDEEPSVSEGATWIIKALVEDGHTLTPGDIERLIEGLDKITAWQAQLHVCQFVCRISVPKEAALTLEQWLTALLDAPRPFLRAWAVDALCRWQPTFLDRIANCQRATSHPATAALSLIANFRSDCRMWHFELNADHGCSAAFLCLRMPC